MPLHLASSINKQIFSCWSSLWAVYFKLLNKSGTLYADGPGTFFFLASNITISLIVFLFSFKKAPLEFTYEWLNIGGLLQSVTTSYLAEGNFFVIFAALSVKWSYLSNLPMAILGIL